ncbi:MAG TPA: SPASM domain-containing protein [Syntrophorhabdaceae bacterium]|nr:SPASM domain-containing protein [Syntrophorhabdaceae bacterium]
MNISELSGIRDMLLDRNIAWQIQIAGSEGGRFPNKLLLDKEEFYSVGMFIAATREKYSLEQMPVVGADDLGFNSMMLNNVSFSPEWNGCHAGISVLGIQSNGDVKGCLSMADLPAEGNVRSANIYDIWNGNTTFSYSRKFDVSEAGENCINCIYVEKCKGGCNEMSLMRTGKLHNDPYCFYAIEKRLFDHELRNPLNRIRLKLKRKMNEIIEKKASRFS